MVQELIKEIILPSPKLRKRLQFVVKNALWHEAVLRAREMWLKEVIENDLNKYEAMELWFTKYVKIAKQIWMDLVKEVTNKYKFPFKPSKVKY